MSGLWSEAALDFGGSEKHKIFKDATQGYIQIPAFAVERLIDTFELQRLKDVAQTGIRPIYSGATHDRFSHSIGVYNIGIRIYEGFCKNLLADFPGDQVERERAEALLSEYRPYYYAACILHDIGHPALSHTFEYLYDNKYLKLDEGPAEISKEEVKRLYALHLEHMDDAGKKVELKARLFSCLTEQSPEPVITDGLKPSPHEMMGAYQLLTNCADIQRPVKEAIERWQGQTGGGSGAEWSTDTAVFIACMIIGAQYKLPMITEKDRESKSEDFWRRFALGLRNCVVRLLNGLIDADSMDYLNRNAHFAGYSTSNLDVVRLSNAFSAYYDPKRVLFEPCLEKSAMSALEGFINARNFEPRWLYSHHKIIYYEAFLTKYLYKKCTRYLYARECKGWHDCILDAFQESEAEFCRAYPMGNRTQGARWKTALKRYREELSDETYIPYEDILPADFPADLEAYFASLVETVTDGVQHAQGDANDKMPCIVNTVVRWVDFLAYIREAYQGYVVSPITEFRGSALWYKASDSDINALFKQMYLYYKDRAWDTLSVEEQAVNSRYDLFQEALEEYHTRKYRSSLWKTEEEYHLFLADVQKLTGLSKRVISDLFVRFITDAGEREDFDDVMACRLKDKRQHKVIYLNYTKEQEKRVLGRLENEFDQMFGFLGMGMVICIYEFRYKNFGNLQIRFRSKGNERPIAYSALAEAKKKESEYLPYIYYKKTDVEKDSAELCEQLKKNLVTFLLNRYGGYAMQTTSYLPERGKIIRDPVHGDIFVPERFLKVIDTRVFQRLRRIKQLATADYVFPEAGHTRFAHALGTFHIMTLMVNRICALFDYLQIPCTQTEKDAVLMAALLHDVGHGPYSHAFEKLSGNLKSHEEWTCEIIRDDPELRSLFDAHFGRDFSTLVIGCLRHDEAGADDRKTLRYVFSSLISSQLDADRLDYLMRDSLNTGVKLGIVDLQKIIASLELTQYNGELAVCVAEDALSSIEQLIIGRFNMYDTVYFAPYKAFSEQLLINMIKRISESGSLPPESRLHKMLNNTLTLDEYVQLDDSVIQSEIYQYRDSCTDQITKAMIDSFFNRRGYERLRIMNESAGENYTFINELEKKFQISVQNLYAFVCRAETYSAYTYKEGGGAKDSILIVGRNGVVSDLFQKSKIIGNSAKPADWPNAATHILEGARSCIYLNEEILKMELSNMGSEVKIEQVREFIEEHSLRKHTEIEEKYSCSADAIQKGKDILQALPDSLAGYCICGEVKSKRQEDTYYDTDDFLLARNDCSFRCRKRGEEKFVFTVKESIDPNNGENGGQFIRSEYELEAESAELNDTVLAFAAEHFSELFKGKDSERLACLSPKITVKNDRASCDVLREHSNFKCEVSLDSVEYLHDGKSSRDWQVEIELKSQEPIHRVELTDFASKFGAALGIDTEKRETLSKYGKALEAFGLLE